MSSNHLLICLLQESDEDAKNAEKLEPDITTTTMSEKLFKEVIDKYYTPLEIWYTRTIIDKVLQFTEGTEPSLINSSF